MFIFKFINLKFLVDIYQILSSTTYLNRWLHRIWFPQKHLEHLLFSHFTDKINGSLLMHISGHLFLDHISTFIVSTISFCVAIHLKLEPPYLNARSLFFTSHRFGASVTLFGLLIHHHQHNGGLSLFNYQLHLF